MTKVSAMDELIISARLSSETVTGISLVDADTAKKTLTPIVAYIRSRIGAEPEGSKLVVSGRFANGYLVWGVYFRHLDGNDAHADYLRKTATPMRELLVNAIAA